ncbi:hypothetical protein PsorP6_016256 [Peronosclerospora sorghi]|uniref:Uncharacterized protein n=1 Tax=Peronosclerospora sorghi TaxID=230839 RepID=A0ACC0VKX0_9STRA|nr:hypothetical protein PsorP6_016256 [Peronosclerospora sorghi]
METASAPLNLEEEDDAIENDQETAVFLSFYLIVTLEISATSIAIVTLLVYLSGFVATFCLRRLYEYMGRAGSFALGAGFIVLLLTLSYYLSPDTSLWIYPLSSILGMSNSIIMVKSVCLTGDLVGTHVESGAFVYGAMSFTDKISNGLTILFIQTRGSIGTTCGKQMARSYDKCTAYCRPSQRSLFSARSCSCE